MSGQADTDYITLKYINRQFKDNLGNDTMICCHVMIGQMKLSSKKCTVEYKSMNYFENPFAESASANELSFRLKEQIIEISKD